MAGISNIISWKIQLVFNILPIHVFTRIDRDEQIKLDSTEIMYF